MSDLTVDRLETAARQRTQTSDFGGDEHREPLGVLLDSALTEGRMNEAGRSFLFNTARDNLVNRLEIQDWVSRHPEIRSEIITPPIIVASGPRTGTTAAGFLLGCDPENRCLLSWEARKPCPPPDQRTIHEDPRIAQMRPDMESEQSRAFRRIHIGDVEGPDECHFLLSNAFHSPHFTHLINTPSQYAWATRECDMIWGYEYHRLQLQLLQWRNKRERWALKNPPHLLYNEEIHSVYPDATFVHIHRDPVEMLGSICSLTRIMRRRNSDEVDDHEIGRHMLEMIADSMDRTLDFRDRHPEVRIADIPYQEFVETPVRAMSRVYEAAGLPFTEFAEEAMARWASQNPAGLHGIHEYDLSEFGVEYGELRERLGRYCHRFDVPLAGSPP
ncbi:sulfotransferase [Myxococcota bacterium]|nr:sulfotransferase [Myxococcota bacterium]